MSGEDRPIQVGDEVPIVTLEVARDGLTGGLQLSINTLDAEGHGGGYRLAGPKFIGRSQALLVATLTQDQADAIRQHLGDAFPIRRVGGEAEQPVGADGLDVAYVKGIRSAASFLSAFDQSLPAFDRETCRRLLDGVTAMADAAEARLGLVSNGSSAAAVTGEATEPLRTPREWSEIDGLVVMDPDGWRFQCGNLPPRDFNDPISRAEWEQRMAVSTVSGGYVFRGPDDPGYATGPASTGSAPVTGTGGRVMKLYCWQHNAVHDATAGEAERIIYAFTGAYADEVCEADPTSRPEAGESPWDHNVCPLEVLRWSYDGEMYAEHVEQGVECRLAEQRPVATETGDEK